MDEAREGSISSTSLNAGSAGPIRLSEVQIYAEKHSKLLSTLETVLKMLDGKLLPALRPALDRVEVDELKSDMVPQTDLGRFLQTKSETVEGLIDHVNSLIDRIEL